MIHHRDMGERATRWYAAQSRAREEAILLVATMYGRGSA